MVFEVLASSTFFSPRVVAFPSLRLTVSLSVRERNGVQLHDDDDDV